MATDGIDAVAIVEAMRRAYPGRSEDYCRQRVAECIASEEEAFEEWTAAMRHYEPRGLADLLRPLWSAT